MDAPVRWEDLKERLASADATQRRDAVLAALTLPSSPEILASLERLAESDPAVEVRYVARKGLDLVRQRDAIRAPEKPRVESAPDKLQAKFRDLLSDPSPRTRMLAISKILKYRDHRLLPPIVEILEKEENAQVIGAALSVLGELGSSEHLAAVARCLASDNARVVANAVTALARLGGPESVPRLAPLMDHPDNRVRGNAVMAIMPHDPKQAFERLESMVRSPDVAFRASALYVLGQIEDPRAARLVKAMLAAETDEGLREQAHDLADRLEPGALADDDLDAVRSALVSRDVKTRAAGLERAIAHLQAMECRSLVEAVAGLDPSEELRARAARALREGPADAAQAAGGLVPLVSESMVDEGLGSLVLPAGASPLAGLEGEEPEAPERLSGVVRATIAAEAQPAAAPGARPGAPPAGGPAPASVGAPAPVSEETRQRLMKKFRSLMTARSERMRIGAHTKVVKYHDKELLPVVLESLDLETSPRVVAAALAAVGALGGPTEVSILAPYLRHGNARVVGAAILALTKLGGDEAMSLFLPLLNRQDPRVRTFALLALLRSNRDVVIDYVVRMAGSPIDTVRANALACAASIDSAGAQKILMALVETEGDLAVLGKAYRALAEVATGASIGPLWIQKKKFPGRTNQITEVFEAVAKREQMDIKALQEIGAEFAAAHPELLELAPASQDTAEKLMGELESGQRRTRGVQALPPPAPRPAWPIWAGAAAVVLVAVYAFGTQGEGTEGKSSRPVVSDQLAHLIENYKQKSQVVKPISIDAAGPSGTVEPARMEEVGRLYGSPPPVTREMLMAYTKEMLHQQNWKNEEYVELEVLGADREVYEQAVKEADRLVEAKDLDGAVKLLTDALAATSEKNLLVLRDLRQRITQIQFKAGHFDRAKDQALKTQDLDEKIIDIYAHTPLPWAPGRTRATPEEVARVKEQRSRIEKEFAEVAEHKDEAADPDKAINDAKMKVAQEAAQFKQDGKLSAADYDKAMKVLSEGPKDEPGASPTASPAPEGEAGQ